jgi:hypothetical protein
MIATAHATASFRVMSQKSARTEANCRNRVPATAIARADHGLTNTLSVPSTGRKAFP